MLERCHLRAPRRGRRLFAYCWPRRWTLRKGLDANASSPTIASGDKVRITRLDLLLGALVFLVCFVIYIRTLCPDVYWGDSGVLTTAAATLGVPSPPGHPLYVLIGNLFSRFPLGRVAWRLNVMSAFFGALTCSAVFFILTQLIRPWVRKEDGTGARVWLPCIAASLCFALSSSFWSAAVVAEAYTLETFLLAALVLLTLSWGRRRSGRAWPRRLLLCSVAFGYGLAVCTDLKTLILLPAFVLFVVMCDRKALRDWRLWLMTVGAFVLGLLPYLYIPLRSAGDPALDWGNPERFRSFCRFVTTKHWSGDLCPSRYVSHEGLADKAATYLRLLRREFSSVLVVVALLGVIAVYRRSRACFGLTTAFFVISLTRCLGWPERGGPDQVASFIPSFLMFSVWLGVGMSAVAEVLSARVAPAKRAIASWTLLLVFTVAPFCSLYTHVRLAEKSDHIAARVYGMSILRPLRRGAVLFVEEVSTLGIVLYLQLVEGIRPDVCTVVVPFLGHSGYVEQLMSKHGDVVMPAGPEFNQFRRHYVPRDRIARPYAAWRRELAVDIMIGYIVSKNQGRHPIYWELGGGDKIMLDRLVPHGLVMSIRRDSAPRSVPHVSTHREIWERLHRLAYTEECFISDESARSHYCHARLHLGRFYERRGLLNDAINEYRKARIIDGYDAAAAYRLGTCYGKKGRHDWAVIEYRRAVELMPKVPAFHLDLADSYAKQSRFWEAIWASQRALGVDPRNVRALNDLGVYLAAVGRLEEARRSWQEVQDVDPGNARAARLLSAYPVAPAPSAGH